MTKEYIDKYIECIEYDLFIYIDYMYKMITSFLQHPLDHQPMFIAKVAAQTRFFWNGQSQNGKKGMVSFEVTGLNIIREHCGMVSNFKGNFEKFSHQIARKAELFKYYFY